MFRYYFAACANPEEKGELDRFPSPLEASLKRIWKLWKEESGVVIAEAALILPVFIFVGLGILDLVLMAMQISSINNVAYEVAHCEALRETNPTANLPCNPSTTGVSAQQYAIQQAQNWHLPVSDLSINTPNCEPALGTCKVVVRYDFKPYGVWFPIRNIIRTAVVSYSPPSGP